MPPQSGDVLMTRTAQELGDDAWAPNADGVEVPIVRVVATESGDRRELISYGPDGEFLKATLQFAEE